MSDTENNTEIPALEGIVVQVKETLGQVPMQYRLEVIKAVLTDLRADLRKDRTEAQQKFESASKQEEEFHVMVDEFTKHLKDGT